jgi:hypothetical protein
MTQVANAGSDNVAPQRTPGYLMAPFGWAAMPLAAMFEADPTLYAALFTISRRRMHLIALALAHVQSETDATFARLIMHGAPRAILDAVLGRLEAFAILVGDDLVQRLFNIRSKNRHQRRSVSPFMIQGPAWRSQSAAEKCRSLSCHLTGVA